MGQLWSIEIGFRELSQILRRLIILLFEII
jgi:hypothetical protein